jgi:hypothetical protein
MYFVGACWAFPATWTPALTRMTPRLLAAAGGAKAQQGVCVCVCVCALLLAVYAYQSYYSVKALNVQCFKSNFVDCV